MRAIALGQVVEMHAKFECFASYRGLKDLITPTYRLNTRLKGEYIILARYILLYHVCVLIFATKLVCIDHHFCRIAGTKS